MGVVAANLAALRDISERMRQLRTNLQPVAAKRIAAAFHKEIADEFRQSRDPYGRPWKPVFRNRARDRRARAKSAAKGRPVRADKPLVDTGRLRASVIVRAEGTRVRLALPVEYASYHQYGTSRMARRQILPESDTGGLGPRWTLAANREVLAVFNQTLKGR